MIPSGRDTGGGMARLRVAYVYSYMTTGGDESRLLQHLACRDDRRFEHVVVTGMEPNAASVELNGPVHQRVRDLGVELVSLGVPADHDRRRSGASVGLALSQGRAFGSMVRRLARFLAERRVDIVDGRINMGTAVGVLAARRAGVRAVVSTNYELGRWQTPTTWAAGQALYAMTDALISDSQAAIDQMRGWMLRPPPGFCIPNGVVPPAPTRAAEAMRAELGIPPGARVIAQIARIQRIKGQDLLLKAVARLRERHPDVFLLLVGYRQQAVGYQRELDELVDSLGLQDAVRFVSWPGPIGDIWQLVDIHAHPTRQDSSPMALMEGMSLGRPAVTTRVGGIADIVEDGRTGFVLEPDDLDGLTRALGRLLDAPGLAAQLGAAAHDRFSAHHRPEVMARGIEAVYAQVHADPRGVRLDAGAAARGPDPDRGAGAGASPRAR